jgi:2-pyrone-4,6-dicarboxylate lactonase
LSDVLPPDARLHYEDMAPFVKKVLSERPDRCVWGSNWPHPGLHAAMPNDAELVDLLDSWLPSDAVRVPLFSANATKLYRFEAERRIDKTQ